MDYLRNAIAETSTLRNDLCGDRKVHLPSHVQTTDELELHHIDDESNIIDPFELFVTRMNMS